MKRVSALIFMWAVLAAQAPTAKESARQASEPEQRAAIALEGIASGVREASGRAAKSENGDRGCGHGRYEGSADLCAQWKAADAAMEAATHAKRGNVISLVASILSLIGIGLVWRSLSQGQAGLELARKTNQDTREIGEAQVRCYVRASRAWIEIDEKGLPLVRVRFGNAGQSPALKHRWVPTISYQSSFPSPAWKHTAPDFKDHPSQAIAAGKSLARVWKDYGVRPQADLWALLRDQALVRVTVAVHASWDDVFGKHFNETFTFHAALTGASLVGLHKLKRSALRD